MPINNIEVKDSKPFKALNDRIYISLRHQKLQRSKYTGYDFYCKEHFVTKYKSKYSCETPFFFYLSKEIILDNCNFNYCYNNTFLKPAILNGSSEIISANWLKKILLSYTTNNDTPVKIPNYS